MGVSLFSFGLFLSVVLLLPPMGFRPFPAQGLALARSSRKVNGDLILCRASPPWGAPL